MRTTLGHPWPSEPTESERAEADRLLAMTPWKRHQEETTLARPERTKPVVACRTWDRRPLLCRLGIHRPAEKVGRSKNDVGRLRCQRCTYEWTGMW